PILAALFLMALLRAKLKGDPGRGHEPALLYGLLGYVCLKGLFNFVHMDVNGQGEWYYVFSIMIVNFMCVVMPARARWPSFTSDRFVRASGSAILGTLVFLHVIFVLKQDLTAGNKIFRFWQDRRAVSSILETKAPGAKLVEYDDGIISFSLGRPTIHAQGFVIDAQGYEAIRKGKFLSYCHNRGFNVIGSVQYLRLASVDVPSSAIEAGLTKEDAFRGQDVSGFTYEVLFVHRETGATFVRFKPK
ncbi:MAG: hypothetical protein V2B18_15615, partial [Pseudomonadota bacterium]